MSDLFDKEHELITNNEFNPYDHFKSLCEGGRIKPDVFGKVEYKKGWTKILEELITTIKGYPVEICSITGKYAELDVDFIFHGKAHEVKVWRAIKSAVYDSRTTCMRCGNSGTRMVRGEDMIVMCRSCTHEDEKNGVTGTWLDRY